MAVQWTTVGDVEIDIGANPSAEEAEEGVESNNRKTVDIIESFRLNVSLKPPQRCLISSLGCCMTYTSETLSLRPLAADESFKQQ